MSVDAAGTPEILEDGYGSAKYDWHKPEWADRSLEEKLEADRQREEDLMRGSRYQRIRRLVLEEGV
ncbi:MAG: hypothetical protein R6W82_02875 [bacterium]